MPIKTEDEKGSQNGKLKSEFGGLPQEPDKLAQMLDVLYRHGSNTYAEDDEGFDRYVEGYIDFLRMLEISRPESRQIKGYMAYCKWSLNKSSPADAIGPMLDAVREYEGGRLARALQEVASSLELYTEPKLLQEKPVLLLPHIKPVKLAWKAEPRDGLSAPRGKLFPVSSLDNG